MTYLVERLAELRVHLDHLRSIRSRVTDVVSLRRDRSLHNDVLFSLLMVAQLVIDIAGELGARRGMPFDNYTAAVRNLASFPEFDPEAIDRLARLPGFRNVLIHDYVTLDLERAVRALDELDLIEDFLTRAAALPEMRDS